MMEMTALLPAVQLWCDWQKPAESKFVSERSPGCSEFRPAIGTLASKQVSPKGPGSAMRMLTYFINRAGRGLSAERRAELEKAKSILTKRVEHERQNRRFR